MAKPNGKRTLGFLLATVLAGGLIAVAAVGVMRWYNLRDAKQEKDANNAFQTVAVSETPMVVQETASTLADSRAGFVVPTGQTTYLVISTGSGGERVQLDSVKTQAGSTDVYLRQSVDGARLLVIKAEQSLAPNRQIRYFVDGFNTIPAVINTDNLPPAPLPAKGTIALVMPKSGGTAFAGQLQVSGYARMTDGRLTIRVMNEGKGRVLGEATGIGTASQGTDWGTFRISVPVNVPAGVTTGWLIVLNEQNSEQVKVPIRFSSK